MAGFEVITEAIVPNIEQMGGAEPPGATSAHRSYTAN
jgi:hypothetical protein